MNQEKIHTQLPLVVLVGKPAQAQRALQRRKHLDATGKWEADLKRFWTKVNKRKPNECWEWLGGVGKGGYGNFPIDSWPYKAHRVSYTIHYGQIPEGLIVCHKCDNPICVNPNHLFLGTHQDNIKDRDQKGRTHKPIGEQNIFHKLTWDQVRQIRSMDRSGLSYSDIAKMYGVSDSNIHMILTNKTWKHEEGT